MADRTADAALPVERDDLVEGGAGTQNVGVALEPVALTRDRVDDVHFDGGILAEVGDRAR